MPRARAAIARKRLPSHIVIVLLLSLTASPLAALPEGQWYEVSAVDATFYGSIDRQRLAAFVHAANLVSAALDGLGEHDEGPFLAHAPAPTYVYLFADADSYRPYQHRDGGGPAFVDGTHFGRPHAGYITLNATSARAARAFTHELVHRRLPAGVPRWAEEGLAEVFASVHVVDGQLWIGAPDSAHRETLAGEWLSFDEIVAVNDLGSPRYRVGRSRALFYAQSWLLVHYLWSDPARRAETVVALRAGHGPPLPPADALRVALREHLAAGPAPIAWGPAPSLQPLARDRVDAMRYADVLYRLGDLLLIQGDRDRDAAEHFRTALGIDSGHGSALGGLALLAERAGDIATARERFGRAVELDPDDALLRFRFGRSLLAPVGAGEIGDQFVDGRREMRRALELSDGAVWLRQAIGRVYLQRLGPLLAADRVRPARAVLDAYRDVVPRAEWPPLAVRFADRLVSVPASGD